MVSVDSANLLNTSLQSGDDDDGGGGDCDCDDVSVITS